MGWKRMKFIILFVLSIIVLYYLMFYQYFKIHESEWKFLDIAENLTDILKDETMKTIADEEYLLKPSCINKYKYLLLITSAVFHVELRSAHRRAYPQDYLEKLGVKRVFLIANIANTNLISQNAIENEQKRFNDMVQGVFMDSYKNLTKKHIMGLKWAYTECSLTNFIIKLDDDMVFNLNIIIHLIDKYSQFDKNNFLMGYVLKSMKPIRIKVNKWFVEEEEYSKAYYPPFLSGWMYVTTPEVAKVLISGVLNTKYFWIDDVFITGIIASKMNIKLIDISKDKIFLEYYELMDCCLNDMIMKNITCEYALGPNGNDDNMILKFTDALRSCYIKKCHNRPIYKPLNETCVSSKKTSLFNKGKPVINVMRL